MIAGFLGFLGTKVLTEMGIGTDIFVNLLDPFFIGLAASLLFAVIGSKVHPVTEVETEYRENLMKLPKEEASPKEYRRDRVYGNILIVTGVIVTLVLIFGWALPYNGWI